MSSNEVKPMRVLLNVLSDRRKNVTNVGANEDIIVKFFYGSKKNSKWAGTLHLVYKKGSDIPTISVVAPTNIEYKITHDVKQS